MKEFSTDLHRYETLLGQARRAAVSAAALERQAPQLDGHTRDALIHTLESGLNELKAAGARPVKDRLAKQRHDLESLRAEAQNTFASLGIDAETDPPAVPAPSIGEPDTNATQDIQVRDQG
jgi:hypothetical protein